MVIFTIGYEGRTIGSFMSSLRAYGVETVVDVRQNPISRKPGFSKRSLAAALKMSDIDYVHLASLGCPRPVRDRYRDDGNWTRYTSGFMAYLATQGLAVAELSHMVASSDCALLCFEADYRLCHRSMVADAVRNHCGAEIVHIPSAKAKIATAEELRLSFS